MGITVAVTGCNSYFASTLLPRLEADPEVDTIVGIDIVPQNNRGGKIRFKTADVRSHQTAKLLKGADIVYHLAFVVSDFQDEAAARDINVNGSRNVFRACVQHGVRKVIYASSMTVYGARPDTPPGLTEDAPLFEHADSPYNSCKIEVERIARQIVGKAPGTILTILRAGLLCGPHINNMFSRLWERRIAAMPLNRHPHLQLIHEEDLAEAMELARKIDLPGVFNVCADDTIATRWAFRAAGARIVYLPSRLLKIVSNLLFRLRLDTVSGGWVSLGEHTIFGDCSRFKQAAGWQPRFTSRQTFEDFLASRR